MTDDSMKVVMKVLDDLASYDFQSLMPLYLVSKS